MIQKLRCAKILLFQLWCMTCKAQLSRSILFAAFMSSLNIFIAFSFALFVCHWTSLGHHWTKALCEERRRQHAAEAAELRKRLEKARRRSLRQLLLRLAGASMCCWDRTLCFGPWKRYRLSSPFVGFASQNPPDFVYGSSVVWNLRMCRWRCPISRSGGHLIRNLPRPPLAPPLRENQHQVHLGDASVAEAADLWTKPSL